LPVPYWRKFLRQPKIISNSGQSFVDRKEAGKLLAAQLNSFSGKGTVVIGIPRGGVVIAAEVASLLNTELDVVLSRKIGAPGNPELGIGSVGEDGKLFINEELALRVGADTAYIEGQRRFQLGEIKKRVSLYRKIKPKVSLSGKRVIVTDDGIATGSTMQSALFGIRQEKPEELIAAIPVAAKSAAFALMDYADQVIVLREPEFLGAISQFYDNFGQTSDEEVLHILKSFAKKADAG